MSNTETTLLTPAEEVAFQRWAKANNLTDVDHPDAHYDYRGFWKEHPTFQRAPGEHLTDKFKQHGHPTFSQESQYSQGAYDGGQWVPNTFTPEGLAVSHQRDDLFMPQPKMATSSPFEQILLRRLLSRGGK